MSKNCVIHVCCPADLAKELRNVCALFYRSFSITVIHVSIFMYLPDLAQELCHSHRTQHQPEEEQRPQEQGHSGA